MAKIFISLLLAWAAGIPASGGVCRTPWVGSFGDYCYDRAAVSDEWIVVQRGDSFYGYQFTIDAGVALFTNTRHWGNFLEDGEEVWSLHIAESLGRAIVYTDRGNFYLFWLTDTSASQWTKIHLPELMDVWAQCHDTECIAYSNAAFLTVTLQADAAQISPLDPAPEDLWFYDFNAETLLAATTRGVSVFQRQTGDLDMLDSVAIPYAWVYAGPGYHLAINDWGYPIQALLITIKNGRVISTLLNGDDFGYFSAIMLPYLYRVSAGIPLEWPGNITEYYLHEDGRLESVGSNWGSHDSIASNKRTLLTYSSESDWECDGASLFRSCDTVPAEFRPALQELCDGEVKISTGAPVESLSCNGRSTPVEGGFQYEKISCDYPDPHQYFSCRMRDGEWNVEWDFHLPCRGTDAMHIGGDRFIEKGRPALMEGPEGYAQYTWADGITEREREITQGGSYGLTVQTADGCVRTDASHLIVPTARNTPRTLVPFPAVGLPLRLFVANPGAFPVKYGLDVPGRSPEWGVIPARGQVRLEPDPLVCSDTAGFLIAEAPVAARVEVKPGPWWLSLAFRASSCERPISEQPGIQSALLVVNGDSYDVLMESVMLDDGNGGDLFWTPPQESRLVTKTVTWSGFNIYSDWDWSDYKRSLLVFDESDGLPFSCGWALSGPQYEVSLCPFAFRGNYQGLSVKTSVELSQNALVCLYPSDDGARQCIEVDKGYHADILSLFESQSGHLTLTGLPDGFNVLGLCALDGSDGYQWILDPRTWLKDELNVLAGVTGHLVLVIYPGWGKGPLHITQRGGSGALYSDVTITLPVVTPQFLFFDAPTWDPGYLLIDQKDWDYDNPASLSAIEFRPEEGDFQALQPVPIDRVDDSHSPPLTRPQ